MAVILTVEDETIVSAFLGEVLRDAGYRVIAAANADEAIAILEARER
jgi:CheY-like chemotaxis protein